MHNFTTRIFQCDPSFWFLYFFRHTGVVFFSTINRNPKSYVMLVLGAEYVLNILPRGTHEYSKFIKPSELAQALRDAELDVLDIRGMHYNPLTRSCRLNKDTNTNYIVHARKPA